MKDNEIDQDRPLTVTRRSLIYVVAYLVVGGVGLMFAPQTTLGILMSKADYGDVFPRVAGMFMISLGIHRGSDHSPSIGDSLSNHTLRSCVLFSRLDLFLYNDARSVFSSGHYNCRPRHGFDHRELHD